MALDGASHGYPGQAEADRHADDLYAWSRTQTDLLRAGRLGELDPAHLIEEIEDVGGAMKRSMRKRIRTILEHLLRLEHSPASEPRAGWRATVRTQRVRLRDTLTPTLRREVEQELAELYEDVRGLAEGAFRDHGETAAAEALPRTCPCSFDQLRRAWYAYRRVRYRWLVKNALQLQLLAVALNLRRALALTA